MRIIPEYTLKMFSGPCYREIVICPRFIPRDEKIGRIGENPGGKAQPVAVGSGAITNRRLSVQGSNGSELLTRQ